jgi:ABC-2 type transport system ATP-binding protein
MQHAAVAVHDLDEAYDRQPVFRGLSLALDVGEIFTIPGRNGAGNTMTMEILQGVRSRDGGHVALLGLDPAVERRCRLSGGL